MFHSINLQPVEYIELFSSDVNISHNTSQWLQCFARNMCLKLSLGPVKSGQCTVIMQEFMLMLLVCLFVFLACADAFSSDGRTDPVLDDVSQAFRLLGVSLSELEDYVHNLEPVGFAHQTPLFPVSKNNVLQFPQPGARDAEERKEYIPDYLPPLVSLQEGQYL